MGTCESAPYGCDATEILICGACENCCASFHDHDLSHFIEGNHSLSAGHVTPPGLEELERRLGLKRT